MESVEEFELLDVDDLPDSSNAQARRSDNLRGHGSSGEPGDVELAVRGVLVLHVCM